MGTRSCKCNGFNEHCDYCGGSGYISAVAELQDVPAPKTMIADPWPTGGVQSYQCRPYGEDLEEYATEARKVEVNGRSVQVSTKPHKNESKKAPKAPKGNFSAIDRAKTAVDATEREKQKCIKALSRYAESASDAFEQIKRLFEPHQDERTQRMLGKLVNTAFFHKSRAAESEQALLQSKQAMASIHQPAEKAATSIELSLMKAWLIQKDDDKSAEDKLS